MDGYYPERKPEMVGGILGQCRIDNPLKNASIFKWIVYPALPQNPSDHFWFSFRIITIHIQHYFKQLVEIKKGFRE